MSAETLVAAAGRAPSSHNTQPWRFRYDGDQLQLWADRTRRLPMNDPEDRELTISCGAALFTLEVAAAATGRSCAVTLLPHASSPDLLAEITLFGPAGPPGGLARLLPQVNRRRTSRGALTEPPTSRVLRQRLDAVAREHSFSLSWVPPGFQRDAIAALVYAGDRVQFEQPAWRSELASWMRPHRAGDGLTSTGVSGAVVRAVVRHVDVGARTGRTDRDLVRKAPLLAVLGSTGDEPRDWLEVGRALQHLLLEATVDGVSAGFENQPCQVTQLRQGLTHLLPDLGHPQVVLRLGLPGPARRPSPRRPVDEYFEVLR